MAVDHTSCTLYHLYSQDHMSSSVATNVIVRVENIDHDDDGVDDKNNDINDLVIPSPPVDSSSSHDNHDDDKDDDEMATPSTHELSVSPDHQLPREQDGSTEKPDQSSTTDDDVPPDKPDQSSSDVTSQELLPSPDEVTPDDTNLLTAI